MTLITCLLVLAALAAASTLWGADSRDLRARTAWPFFKDLRRSR